jgi:hypothetical protein
MELQKNLRAFKNDYFKPPPTAVSTKSFKVYNHKTSLGSIFKKAASKTRSLSQKVLKKGFKETRKNMFILIASKTFTKSFLKASFHKDFGFLLAIGLKPKNSILGLESVLEGFYVNFSLLFMVLDIF